MVRSSVAIAMLALAASVAPTAAGAPVDPKALVLKQEDVKPFALQSSGSLSLADAARAMPAGWRQKLVRWGRRGGFESRFYDSKSERYLISGAAVYGTMSGARQYLAAIFRSPPAPKSMRRVPAGTRLGHETRLYVYSMASQGMTLQIFYLTWRQTNVVGGLVLGGRKGRVTAAQVRLLGQQQRVRIRRALHAS